VYVYRRGEKWNWVVEMRMSDTKTAGIAVETIPSEDKKWKYLKMIPSFCCFESTYSSGIARK